MAVDYATKAILDQLASAGGKPLHEGTVEEARDLGKAFAAMAGPAPAMGRIVDHQVPVAGGAIPVRVLVPPQGARGVIVYLHGGGWVIGAIDEFDTMARKLAERTSCAVVLVDYRLAPGAPLPHRRRRQLRRPRMDRRSPRGDRRPRRRPADRRGRQRRGKPRRGRWRCAPATATARRSPSRCSSTRSPTPTSTGRRTSTPRTNSSSPAMPWSGSGTTTCRTRRAASSPTRRPCAPRASPVFRRP